MTAYEEMSLMAAVGILKAVPRAHRVSITYQGSGDEGQTPQVYLVDIDGVRIDDGLTPAIEELFEHWADSGPLAGVDYSNGEGGYGDITINLRTLRVVHVHHDCYVATTDTTNRFKFGDTTKERMRA